VQAANKINLSILKTRPNKFGFFMPARKGGEIFYL
jgi:hypothetical protein